MSHIKIRCAVGSDKGLVRPVNEDSAYAGRRIFAVADGMGGHAHGEVASAVAIKAIAACDRRCRQRSADLLSDVVASIGARLTELASRDARLTGMGTTLTALLIDGARCRLAHVGDSRAYLLRAGELTQLTRDHTFVQSLVDDGRLTAEQAVTYPRRSMLMRALQAGSSAHADHPGHETRPGDRFLLCSDGLTSMVDDVTVRDVLAATPHPGQAVTALIARSRAAGAPDNVTCVVIDVLDGSSWWPRQRRRVLTSAHADSYVVGSRSVHT
jgi:protein phosphatase